MRTPAISPEPARTDAISKRDRSLIEEALEIEQEEAKEAGALGFMARTLAQITLPHTDPKATFFSRTNGRITLSIVANPNYGLPYGTIPRMVLAWICTEAVRTKCPELSLGRSQKEFAGKLGLHYNGRDIGRLRDQSLRLFRALISVDGGGPNTVGFENILIARRAFVFWGQQRDDQPSLWDSSLVIDQGLFDEITTSPVPVDLRVVQALTKSPLAMDIYTWLVYRMFVLRVSRHQEARVPWAGLRAQFGAGYADDEQGLQNFRKKFKQRLREVLLFYPQADDHISDTRDHLVLTPCRLHIKHTNGARLSVVEAKP